MFVKLSARSWSSSLHRKQIWMVCCLSNRLGGIDPQLHPLEAFHSNHLPPDNMSWWWLVFYKNYYQLTIQECSLLFSPGKLGNWSVGDPTIKYHHVKALDTCRLATKAKFCWSRWVVFPENKIIKVLSLWNWERGKIHIYMLWKCDLFFRYGSGLEVLFLLVRELEVTCHKFSQVTELLWFPCQPSYSTKHL